MSPLNTDDTHSEDTNPTSCLCEDVQCEEVCPPYSLSSLATILGSSIPLTILAIVATVIFTVSVVAVYKYRSKFLQRAQTEDEEEREPLYEEVGCATVYLLVPNNQQIFLGNENESGISKSTDIESDCDHNESDNNMAVREEALQVDHNQNTGTQRDIKTEEECKDTTNEVVLGNVQHLGGLAPHCSRLNVEQLRVAGVGDAETLQEPAPYVFQGNSAYGVMLVGANYNAYENVAEFI